ncbi:MAG: carbon-nitrogen hydrolase family protein [Ghiorsea sp.]
MQLNSSGDIEENLNTIDELLNHNKSQKNQLVLLPENAVLLTNDLALKQQATQKESYEKIFSFFAQQARKHNTWIVAGSLLIQDEANPNKYFNHCPVFSPNGKMVNSYNKMHLFDANLGTESWHESELISAGDKPSTVTIDEHWKMGLSICYDLRFPELFRGYSEQSCNILTVPAAFTVPTGKAHWEVLLRARAIENQSYVLASGQVGLHQDGRKTYGHSMMIDPWGKVLTRLDSEVGMISAPLSLNHINEIQKQLPALLHRRL